jgi:hypothetical protein
MRLPPLPPPTAGFGGPSGIAGSSPLSLQGGTVRRRYSRRPLFANADIAASRVGS